jgi:23S rRNA pseudouridine1911/1915/1917 synthase
MSQRRPFAVLHEDTDIVVVHKSAGVLTVPTPRGEGNTLVQQLRQHLAHGRSFAPRLEVVHRLDRDVSGVLVFARSPQAAETLRRDFAAHRPEREYVALVAGELVAGEGTFASQMLTAKGLQRVSTQREDIGEHAVTHYRVERRLGSATLVIVRLQTGRRNQIRVHFAEAGHPILGETRYRPDLARDQRWTAKRLALHARLLAFAHPVSGQPLRFESPLPPEFEAFLRRSGQRRPRPPADATAPRLRTRGPDHRTSAGRSSAAGPDRGPRSCRRRRAR